jgi:hypothetical protein
LESLICHNLTLSFSASLACVGQRPSSGGCSPFPPGHDRKSVTKHSSARNQQKQLTMRNRCLPALEHKQQGVAWRSDYSHCWQQNDGAQRIKRAHTAHARPLPVPHPSTGIKQATRNGVACGQPHTCLPCWPAALGSRRTSRQLATVHVRIPPRNQPLPAAVLHVMRVCNIPGLCLAQRTF